MFKRFLPFLTISLFLCTVGGFFGRIHWLLDLFAHFRIQYLAIGLFFALLTTVGKQRPSFALSILIVLINGSQIAPYYQSNPVVQVAQSSPTLRLMSANVNAGLGNETATIDAILTSEADIVAIIELNPTLAAQLATINHRYPYQFLQTLDNSHFGIGVISKLPLVQTEALLLGTMQVPTLYAEIMLGNETVGVLATHPSPPFFGRGTDFRNSQLAEIGEFVATSSLPIIVMGDLNATPWSSAMRQLLKITALQDSAMGYGLRPTWISRQHLLGIPIDYVLTSAEFSTLDHTVAPTIDSDHYPIIATLQLNQ